MTEDGVAAPADTEAAAGQPTLNGQPVDPESLDPQQLAQLVEDLDSGELESLLGDLDGEVLGTLVRAAGPDTAKRLLRKVGAGAFDITAIDPASIDPEIFDTELMALLLKLTPDDKLAAAMKGPLRDVVVSEVFRRMPERVDARAAAGTNATIAWRIGRPEGGFDHYLVTIADGRCEVSQGTEVEPRVSLQMDSLTFCKLVTGNSNPVMQFMSGKLSVRGDLMFAATVTRLFDIPSPS
jgi:putative sterol carrier protein